MMNILAISIYFVFLERFKVKCPFKILIFFFSVPDPSQIIRIYLDASQDSIIPNQMGYRYRYSQSVVTGSNGMWFTKTMWSPGRPVYLLGYPDLFYHVENIAGASNGFYNYVDIGLNGDTMSSYVCQVRLRYLIGAIK